jgi:hypothetical protein
MKKNFFKILLFLFLSAIFLSGCDQQSDFVAVKINNLATTADATAPVGAAPLKEQPDNNLVADEQLVSATTSSFTVPQRLELPVLFAQQAPFANWDALHEEACEEASMIMADRYFRQQELNETIMEAEIQKLVNWEAERGYRVDLTAAEVVTVLNNYFGLTARLDQEVTTDKIKYLLAQGSLVLVPAAGRELKNPNFKQPGPIYHMLVIKGYNHKEFITNDPGTRKGNGWVYTYNRLLAAVHDWDHQASAGDMTDEEMSRGQKVMIVVEK